MEQVQVDSLQALMDSGYIPLTDFRNYFKEGARSPYEATFSFSKLIKELQEKDSALQTGSLTDTIASLETMETRVRQNGQSWESLSQHADFESLMIHIFPSFFFEGTNGIYQRAI